LKGAAGLEVFYDRKNDVVSVYFNLNEETNLKSSGNLDEELSSRDYDIDEAANLILDMIDIVDVAGNLKGFRVYNASKYYDPSMLECAESEELSGNDIVRKPSEKVIVKLEGTK
jgi:hypothetical protein